MSRDHCDRIAPGAVVERRYLDGRGGSETARSRSRIALLPCDRHAALGICDEPHGVATATRERGNGASLTARVDECPFLYGSIANSSRVGGCRSLGGHFMLLHPEDGRNAQN